MTEKKSAPATKDINQAFAPKPKPAAKKNPGKAPEVKKPIGVYYRG